MVFFNCNACGEALKKNQVEKHCLRCRQCQSVSCVDCGKDFWGNDYQTHTKCMTENEKYCGKDYIPKVNKGEVKQEQWIEKVQKAIENSSSNPKLKDLLERLLDYPNIPRKKAKFENFLKNSLRVLSPVLISQVWDLLMTASTEATKDTQETSLTQAKKGTLEPLNGQPIETRAIDGKDENTAKSKRERKEERQKKRKKEKKDENGINNVEHMSKKKKGKKRKLAEEEEEDNPEETSKESKKRKKSKKNDTAGSVENGTDNYGSEALVDENVPGNHLELKVNAESVKRKKKFKWESVILDVLLSKKDISLKKLRKKVLNEFSAQDAANYNEENLSAKFDKKLKKMPAVKIAKDRVYLKDTSSIA